MPCPRGIDIPACFTAYNMSYTVGFLSGLQQYLTTIGAINPHESHAPGNCVKCGKCEEHCPQQIPIRDALNTVSRRMEPFWLKIALKLFTLFR
jgi:predicted aldo/keto reductase-like oxidoreductase